ncbi:MAG TPA: amino acid transporter [Fimbriiglobus sp.]|nr:amino acid transporter [Fimbriiglobus sp.]
MPSPEPPAAGPEPSSPSPALPGHRVRFRTAWPWVLCVVGLDYLSSLAYQPSVAFGVAGKLAPLATLGVVAVTLACAVPLYCYLAGRSPHGSGSTGLLERLIPGWRGKLVVLTVLGFAATDLVFTRTFSAADAAEHLTHSPFAPWQSALGAACDECNRLAGELPPETVGHARGLFDRRVVVTLLILVAGSVVAWVYRRGVSRGLIRVASAVLLVYLAMTAAVVGSGVAYLARHPELIDAWRAAVEAGSWKEGAAPRPVGDWWELAAACVTLFPMLALGLSGYEMALTAMPLVRGSRSDTNGNPRGRVRNTRLMLVAAAVVMAALLLSSTLVVTLLIPGEALTTHGKAENRALAYLAHGQPLAGGIDPTDVSPLFGPWFGVVYDVATVAALTLAGVTVVVGMRHLIPPYLYRLGMDWKWSHRWGVLMYVFVLVKLGVTYAYDADPDAQRGAYLTGVLSIFTAASAAALLDVWKRRAGWWKPFRVAPWWLLCLMVFGGSTAVVVWSEPGGLEMAAWFVGVTLVVSVVSRFFRSTELRFRGFEFADEPSRHLWEDVIMRDYPIIVPLRPGGHSLADKEADMRRYHRLPPTLPVLFLMVELGDASNFYQLPTIRVGREDGRVVAHVIGAASTPHVIAAAALEVAKYGVVPEVHFGWSAEHPLTANLNFVLFGMGNVPWMVYELIQAADFPIDRKPRVVVG